MAKKRRPGVKANGTAAVARSGAQRMRLVAEASSLEAEELAAFLRREGILESDPAQWREAMVAALTPGAVRVRESADEAKRIKDLERLLVRRDQELVEAAALLVLQKKVQALRAVWDDEKGPPGDKKR